MTVRREVAGILASSTVLVGFLFGMLNAALAVHSQRFLIQGFHALTVQYFTIGIREGVFWGLLVGIVLALCVIMASPILDRFSRWIQANLFHWEVVQPDAVRGTFLAATLSLYLFALSIYVLNTYIAIHQRPSQMVSAVTFILTATLMLFLASGFVLSRRRLSLDSLMKLHRGLRHMAIGVLVLAVMLQVGWLTLRPRVPEGRPNIFLITVDTMRADHLGCYGYERNTSPNLDRLAKQGHLMLNCYANAPVTGSSFSSIMTGQWPQDTGVYGSTYKLSHQFHTMAEYLKNAGYTTSAVVSNYVLRRGVGFEAGFDTFDDRMEDQELVRRVRERVAEKTTQAALEWLRKNADKAFFFWVHYQDPHGPYTPPEQYKNLFSYDDSSGSMLPFNDTIRGDRGIPSYQRLGNEHSADYYIAQYDAEVRYFDRHLGEFIDGLEGLGLRENSFIVFTSDHGEGMGEHEYYFAHGDYLYRGQLHVPLILWGDSRFVQAGVRDSTLVQHVDILPTVLHVAGISRPPGLRGRNILESVNEEVPVLSECKSGENYKCSLVMEDYLLIYDHFNTEYRAFRISDDSPITDPEILSRPILSKMRSILDTRRNPDALEDRGTQGQQALTREEAEQLRALGYVQ